jgi:beta-glucosidase
VDNLQADLMELSASLLGFHTSQIMEGLKIFAQNLVTGDLLKAAMNPMNLAGVLEQSLIDAFNRAGVAYSGAYRPTVTNIARGEWGYTGWYVTDMINGADYMNWRDVVGNGGGGCLTSSAYDTSDIGAMANSKSLIEKDANFQKEMKQSIKYYVYNIAQSNAMNGISSTTEIVYVRTWVDNAILGAEICLGILTALFLILSIRNDVLSGKKKAKEN